MKDQKNFTPTDGATNRPMETATDPVSIEMGLRVKSLRVLTRMNQKELAEKAGLSYNTVACIETGRYNTSVRNLNKVLDAMGYEIAFVPKARPTI